MRKIKKSEPRKFWKFLNGNKKSLTEVTVEDCFEHFSAMNSSDYDHGPERNFDTNFENLQADNEELNAPILWSEIEKAVSLLKNNKSGGLDMILNEHIKSCYKISSVKDILLKYFNIILDSGIVPQDWSVGNIIPIYKQKGDPSDPANYRPITLLSCLGKLFTSVLNNRLQHFIEKYDKIK